VEVGVELEPGSLVAPREGVAQEIAREIEWRADPASVTQVAAFTRADVPAGRDRGVGVPVLLAPGGELFVAREHSHAALARVILTAIDAPFDPDHPDRTLGDQYGWVMIQAAGHDGLRIQIDRAPTTRQREVVDDLLLYAEHAGRPALLHRGRPVVWNEDGWAENPSFEAAWGATAARRLLKRR
jgi:hypothetical protein